MIENTALNIRGGDGGLGVDIPPHLKRPGPLRKRRVALLNRKGLTVLVVEHTRCRDRFGLDAIFLGPHLKIERCLGARTHVERNLAVSTLLRFATPKRVVNRGTWGSARHLHGFRGARKRAAGRIQNGSLDLFVII